MTGCVQRVTWHSAKYLEHSKYGVYLQKLNIKRGKAIYRKGHLHISTAYESTPMLCLMPNAYARSLVHNVRENARHVDAAQKG